MSGETMPSLRKELREHRTRWGKLALQKAKESAFQLGHALTCVILGKFPSPGLSILIYKTDII